MRPSRFFIAVLVVTLLGGCQSPWRRDDPVAVPEVTTKPAVAYSGWAAILGGGAQARSGSDWHMNRELRIDVDRGPVAVNWRDGQASGHALLLQRIAVKREQQPLLKLSIIDAKGQVIAYAWSEADAQRIGISLGWIQVGLESAATAAPSN